ncbi:MAG TPA: tripartite tricarboxylate transporter substrate binding protein [Xanthobacteraceae bacterium]|jgi:tripartite-type tricarboxylate transporter receptor subunit TctC
MKLPRRRFLRLAAGAAALPAVSRIARAQTYPSRPVRVIVPFAPAGTTDILARLIGQWLSEQLGQSFIVENRPGASTMIGTEAVVRAPADGYTLILAATASAINTTLYEKKISYDFLRDIAPVAGILRVPNVVVVHPSLPVRTIPELIAYAKANPGRINVESPGAGTSSHLAGELFKVMTGVDMVHVQYRGNAPALIDLLAGQVQVGFDTMPASIEYVRAGKLRALAVSTVTRSQTLPDLPTVSEFVPGYESSGYFGLGAPGKTPAEIIDKLNREVNAGLADPKLRAQLTDLGGMILAGSPADFRKLIDDETEKWGKVIRAANIKPD